MFPNTCTKTQVLTELPAARTRAVPPESSSQASVSFFIWYQNISAHPPPPRCTTHPLLLSLPIWPAFMAACFHSAALTKTAEIITAGPKPNKCLSPVISSKRTSRDRVIGRGGRGRLFWKWETNDIISKSSVQSVQHLQSRLAVMYTAHQTSTKLIISDTDPAGREPINLSTVSVCHLFLNPTPPPTTNLMLSCSFKRSDTHRMNLFATKKMLVLCLDKPDLGWNICHVFEIFEPGCLMEAGWDRRHNRMTAWGCEEVSELG